MTDGSSLPAPRALLFDLDDTLLDWAGMVEALERTCAVVAAAHGTIDALAIAAANHLVWQAYWPEVEAGWMLGNLTTERVGREAWRRTLEACGVADPALIELARETLQREELASYRLYDDALDALAAAGARMPIGLVTNGIGPTQREKLAATGIASAFGVVAISGDVRSAKPDGQIFQFALDGLGVGAGSDVWHVGDNLRNDVGGAQAAGLTGIWLNRSGRTRADTDPTPDLEIASLRELVEVLGRLPSR